ncbi:hypothetical protein HDU96_000049 [Phlyctochytrium bullatum]|nr:hypothetical protein HDU96_000049 [Phlyctochytrium bullatum]
MSRLIDPIAEWESRLVDKELAAYLRKRISEDIDPKYKEVVAYLRVHASLHNPEEFQVAVKTGINVVGRAGAGLDGVVLDIMGVSSIHALIEVSEDGEEHFVEDLMSTNGVEIGRGRHRLTQRRLYELTHLKTVCFGPAICTYERVRPGRGLGEGAAVDDIVEVPSGNSVGSRGEESSQVRRPVAAVKARRIADSDSDTDLDNLDNANDAGTSAHGNQTSKGQRFTETIVMDDFQPRKRQQDVTSAAAGPSFRSARETMRDRAKELSPTLRMADMGEANAVDDDDDDLFAKPDLLSIPTRVSVGAEKRSSPVGAPSSRSSAVGLAPTQPLSLNSLAPSSGIPPTMIVPRDDEEPIDDEPIIFDDGEEIPRAPRDTAPTQVVEWGPMSDGGEKSKDISSSNKPSSRTESLEATLPMKISLDSTLPLKLSSPINGGSSAMDIALPPITSSADANAKSDKTEAKGEEDYWAGETLPADGEFGNEDDDDLTEEEDNATEPAVSTSPGPSRDAGVPAMHPETPIKSTGSTKPNGTTQPVPIAVETPVKLHTDPETDAKLDGSVDSTDIVISTPSRADDQQVREPEDLDQTKGKKSVTFLTPGTERAMEKAAEEMDVGESPAGLMTSQDLLKELQKASDGMPGAVSSPLASAAPPFPQLQRQESIQESLTPVKLPGGARRRLILDDSDTEDEGEVGAAGKTNVVKEIPTAVTAKPATHSTVDEEDEYVDVVGISSSPARKASTARSAILEGKNDDGDSHAIEQDKVMPDDDDMTQEAEAPKSVVNAGNLEPQPTDINDIVQDPIRSSDAAGEPKSASSVIATVEKTASEVLPVPTAPVVLVASTPEHSPAGRVGRGRGRGRGRGKRLGTRGRRSSGVTSVTASEPEVVPNSIDSPFLKQNGAEEKNSNAQPSGKDKSPVEKALPSSADEEGTSPEIVNVASADDSKEKEDDSADLTTKKRRGRPAKSEKAKVTRGRRSSGIPSVVASEPEVVPNSITTAAETGDEPSNVNVTSLQEIKATTSEHAETAIPAMAHSTSANGEVDSSPEIANFAAVETGLGHPRLSTGNEESLNESNGEKEVEADLSTKRKRGRPSKIEKVNPVPTTARTGGTGGRKRGRGGIEDAPDVPTEEPTNKEAEPPSENPVPVVAALKSLKSFESVSEDGLAPSKKRKLSSNVNLFGDSPLTELNDTSEVDPKAPSSFEASINSLGTVTAAKLDANGAGASPTMSSKAGEISTQSSQGSHKIPSDDLWNLGDKLNHSSQALTESSAVKGHVPLRKTRSGTSGRGRKRTISALDDEGLSHPTTPSKRSVRVSRDNTPVNSPGKYLGQVNEYRVLFTGLGEEVQGRVEVLGGEEVNSWEECTHLVTDRIRRTVKFLAALAAGKHIMSDKWLDQSEKENGFVACRRQYPMIRRNALWLGVRKTAKCVNGCFLKAGRFRRLSLFSRGYFVKNSTSSRMPFLRFLALQLQKYLQEHREDGRGKWGGGGGYRGGYRGGYGGGGGWNRNKPEKEDMSGAMPPVAERSVFIPKKASLSLDSNEFDGDESANRAGCIHDMASQLFVPPNGNDYSFLPIRPDAANRPLWVSDDGKILLEAFSPLAAPAIDFLITIAEPVSRPSRIHEYRLTTYSLYAAVSVGMETDTLLQVLERYSKNKVPERVKKFIRACTLSYGKVKLVLKHNRYFLESSYPEILRLLLRDPIINQARTDGSDIVEISKPLLPAKGATQSKSDANGSAANGQRGADEGDFGAVILDRDSDDEDAMNMESDFSQSFEVLKEKVEEVKKRCTELDYPLMEEYDFRHDEVNPNLDIDLSPKCIIRDYQEKSLSKMFGGGGGRARSGIIVLPTGAGKTLVGITAACTVKKSTLVLCTNAISVEQWAREFRNWSNIEDGKIAKFTSENKTKFVGESGIVVSTYTMISHSGKRSWETNKMLEFIAGREWGLLILDEVHVVPANVFRKVLTTVAAHTKMGLTATLVREDDKIADLNFLIGPKLYEANWMDLAGRGHIAKVEATEVWCEMTGDFYREYLKADSRKKRLLCVMNPSKFMAAEYLIRTREAANDKIIVFSDNVFALVHYAKALKKPFIYGKTSHEERTVILDHFRKSHPSFKTIFLSKVGDTSLDLPEATCLIQISSQFGSRRQEAQRMGRILRAKRRNEEGFRSRFYTLVSRDTDEVAFSDKRKRFLIDQGYEYKVVSNLASLIPADQLSTLHYSLRKDQLDLLRYIMEQSDEAGEEETLNVNEDDLASEYLKSTKSRGKGGIKMGTGKSAKEIAAEKKLHEKKRAGVFKAFYGSK